MTQPLLLINIAGLGHDCVGSDTPALASLAESGQIMENSAVAAI